MTEKISGTAGGNTPDDSAYVNEVIAGDKVIMSVKDDTVDPEHLAEGYTAHDSTGKPIVGEMKPTVQTDWDETDPASLAYFKNRPFGKVPFGLTWDGTPTGDPVTLNEFPWYKISDAIPESESISDVYTAIETAELGTIKLEANPELLDGILWFHANIPNVGVTASSFIAYEGNSEGFAPGLYCIDLSVAAMMLGATVNSVSIEWTETKTIDQKYLPEALQFGSKRDFSVSWDGTGDLVGFGLEFDFYRVSSVTPTADQLSNVTALLQTPAGGVSSPLTPEYDSNHGMTWLYEYQYSSGATPVLIAYNDNALGIAPGVYIADLAAMSELLGVPISEVTISWTQADRIDPAYLPMAHIESYFNALLKEVVNGNY